MIVSRYNSLPELLRYVGWPLAGLFAWDCAVTAAYIVWGGSKPSLPELPLPLLGSALALFLGFRNTVAYARWWEARTLWGGMVNNSRSFAREVLMLLGHAEGAVLARNLVHRHLAYVNAMRAALRRQDVREAAAPYLTLAEQAELHGRFNVPATLLFGTGNAIRGAHQAGWIDSIGMQTLANAQRTLTDTQGGLERIKNTPLPQQYVYYPRLFVQVFCVLLPLGVLPDLGVFTPVGSTVIGFVFLALDTIGADLQDPFDNRVHDVSMSTLCRSIEIDLRQALGEPAPEPLPPQRGVAW